ncbi:ATP-binding protein [Sphaerisporangium flaviroseum]|uniref:ATP-binding protein n=1 Tax=Sphaerisporangium flaviroseum TaxID=509199 RepID=A0ABP7IUQ6_9ACTN
MSAEAVPPGLLGYVDLPAVTGSVPRARRYVREVLKQAGQTDPYDAELLVGELVANAVKHSESGRRPGGRLTVVIAGCGDGFRIEVIDDGSASSTPQVPAELDENSEGGRGLWLVREMSASWGWHEHVAGRVVWFRLAAAASTG